MADLSELRELTTEDLREKVTELDDQVFRLRLQHGLGQTDTPNKMRQLRRERARVKTLLRERELTAGEES